MTDRFRQHLLHVASALLIDQERAVPARREISSTTRMRSIRGHTILTQLLCPNGLSGLPFLQRFGYDLVRALQRMCTARS